ncbi:trans-2-enoyl-CoA reductase family protein [Parasalinivibrio latis]|uniref:enoyl-ACP reductase FabV n=1 Tax=Parasalinivibrio latis TaxID=2952610 RepID=UPI0030E05F31
MIIKPVVQGVVARTCHPVGCKQAVKNQINYVTQQTPAQTGSTLPKRVLILGASSGFGLSARTALAFGAAKADTLGVSFERGISDKSVGSAGWYNNIWFREFAEQEGRFAGNIVGDAFSSQTREQVVDAIKTHMGGSVDLVIYSLATGVRPNPATGDFWRSVIKPVGEPVTGYSVNIEKGTLESVTMPPASREEIEATEKVMGGEDWQDWIGWLAGQGVLADGFRTVAFSYIGPEQTHALYHHGTLGYAKAHLHKTKDELNQKMASLNGKADIAVCKALVTKASVFIPGLAPYLLALMNVMKQQGTHETCIEQMYRLFYERFYTSSNDSTVTDSNGLIRMDDWELSPDTQSKTIALLEQINPGNFRQMGDYEGFVKEFMQINGFFHPEVDYSQPLNLAELKSLIP